MIVAEPPQNDHTTIVVKMHNLHTIITFSSHNKQTCSNFYEHINFKTISKSSSTMRRLTHVRRPFIWSFLYPLGGENKKKTKKKSVEKQKIQ